MSSLPAGSRNGSSGSVIVEHLLQPVDEIIDVLVEDQFLIRGVELFESCADLSERCEAIAGELSDSVGRIEFHVVASAQVQCRPAFRKNSILFSSEDERLPQTSEDAQSE